MGSAPSKRNLKELSIEASVDKNRAGAPTVVATPEPKQKPQPVAKPKPVFKSILDNETEFPMTFLPTPTRASQAQVDHPRSHHHHHQQDRRFSQESDAGSESSLLLSNQTFGSMNIAKVLDAPDSHQPTQPSNALNMEPPTSARAVVGANSLDNIAQSPVASILRTNSSQSRSPFATVGTEEGKRRLSIASTTSEILEDTVSTAIMPPARPAIQEPLHEYVTPTLVLSRSSSFSKAENQLEEGDSLQQQIVLGGSAASPLPVARSSSHRSRQVPANARASSFTGSALRHSQGRNSMEEGAALVGTASLISPLTVLNTSTNLSEHSTRSSYSNRKRSSSVSFVEPPSELSGGGGGVPNNSSHTPNLLNGSTSMNGGSSLLLSPVLPHHQLGDGSFVHNSFCSGSVASASTTPRTELKHREQMAVKRSVSSQSRSGRSVVQPSGAGIRIGTASNGALGTSGHSADDLSSPDTHLPTAELPSPTNTSSAGEQVPPSSEVENQDQDQTNSPLEVNHAGSATMGTSAQHRLSTTDNHFSIGVIPHGTSNTSNATSSPLVVDGPHLSTATTSQRHMIEEMIEGSLAEDDEEHMNLEGSTHTTNNTDSEEALLKKSLGSIRTSSVASFVATPSSSAQF